MPSTKKNNKHMFVSLQYANKAIKRTRVIGKKEKYSFRLSKDLHDSFSVE